MNILVQYVPTPPSQAFEREKNYKMVLICIKLYGC